MRKILFLLGAVAMVATACGDDVASTTSPQASASTTEGATTAAPVPDSGVADAGHQLVIESVDFDLGVITITNTGSADYDLSGHQLCTRPTYVALPEQVLGAGESIEMPTADLFLTPDNGEIGLYSSRDFGNADAILRYVQWGNGDHGRAGTAEEAGVWTSAAEFVAGGAGLLSTAAADPTSPNDWSAG